MLKTWARFIRLPNCFTAMADPVAGLAIGTAAATYLLAKAQAANPLVTATARLSVATGSTGAVEFDWKSAGLLALAGFLIYAAGIIFNDLADLKIDRVKRPERALPSGAVSVGTAVLVALLLAGAGIGLAWIPHPRTGQTALATFGAVLLYDFVLKRLAPTAALGMALCRGLNFLLGMALPLSMLMDQYPSIVIPVGEWLPLPVLYALQIACLTTLSWTEDRFPVKLTPTWKQQAEAEAAHVAPTPPPSLLAPKLSLWAWVGTLVLISGVSTALIKGNPLMSLPGFVQYLTMLGVFIAVYVRFATFAKLPSRPNLGLTIRNGVLSIPLMWAGVVYAYGARDPIAAHTEFPGLYLPVSLALAALYLPLIGATRWLQTKDA